MMQTADLKLISTDFDGTLFSEFETPPVPERLQQLIATLQAGGAKWVINTGRDMSSLMETLGRAGLSVEPDYLVLVEREIHLHQESRYAGLADWNDACHRAHAELFGRVRRDLPAIVEWITHRFHAQIYEDAFSPFCLIANSNGDAGQIDHYLQAYCQTVPHLTLVRNDVYARFSHDAFNKGTALGEITRRLGLTPRHVFAIGDHLNDLPMLSKRFAACLATNANAVSEVKRTVLEQNGYVSELPHGYGVTDALEFYLNGAPAAATPRSAGLS